jgi:tetratricopeptide (TPR) repeat protein
VQGWLGDMFRMGWALAYWNARKSLFVLRRRRGACPCHNPSDSGRAMETGCDAALQWRQPARFRRVCPLLTTNAKGSWVCSVAADGVRPFWGRAVGYAGGTLLALVVLAAGAAFGTMRVIGYHVTVRQICWPPAWRELGEVRAQLFVEKAQAHFRAGRVHEAVSALMTAHEVAPADYAVAMTLAQVMQAGNPAAADGLYLQMLKVHPEKRTETARVWFLSLLGRGQLADVAELARRQLATDKEQTPAWTHALIFAARHLKQPELLEAAATAPGVPPATGAVLRLEARVRRAPRDLVATALLTEPLPDGFPYALVQRAELLIEFGRPREALGVLAQAQRVLSGRDVVRLALLAYVAAGDTTALNREAGQLLAPARKPGLGEITLVGQHLIRFPNKPLLDNLAAVLEGRLALTAEQHREAWFTVLCAAGAAGDRAVFDRLKGKAVAGSFLNPAGADRLQNFFFGANAGRNLDGILLMAEQMAVDLVYTLLDRYWTAPVAKPGG